jgi:hypothetical protein
VVPRRPFSQSRPPHWCSDFDPRRLHVKVFSAATAAKDTVQPLQPCLPKIAALRTTKRQPQPNATKSNHACPDVVDRDDRRQPSARRSSSRSLRPRQPSKEYSRSGWVCRHLQSHSSTACSRSLSLRHWRTLMSNALRQVH